MRSSHRVCRIGRIDEKMRLIGQKMAIDLNTFAYANRYETDGREENQELVGLN